MISSWISSWSSAETLLVHGLCVILGRRGLLIMLLFRGCNVAVESAESLSCHGILRTESCWLRCVTDVGSMHGSGEMDEG